jgi:hypothetical protein
MAAQYHDKTILSNEYVFNAKKGLRVNRHILSQQAAVKRCVGAVVFQQGTVGMLVAEIPLELLAV